MEKNIVPRKTAEERRATKKKKLADIYMTLGIGVATWLAIILLVFFSGKAIVKGVMTPIDNTLAPEANKPIVPLDQVVIGSNQGATTADPNDPTIPQGGDGSTEPEPPIIEPPPGVDTEIEYTSLVVSDFLYTGSVANMLMLDFPDFSDINSVPQEYIIAFGIIETIKNPDYANGISMSDSRVHVTSSSVELAAVAGLKYNNLINHQSISIGGEFKFDVISKRYSALAHGLDEGVVGRVSAISNNGGIVDMTVEAYNYSDMPEDGSEMSTGANAPAPIKRSKIIVDCTGNVPVVKSMTVIQ